MTIDRSWMELYKALTPDAFDTEMPIDAGTVFIDLLLKLQCPDGFMDWQVFYECLVGRTISRFLASSSVHTIIAAYDDYTNSPMAKAQRRTNASRELLYQRAQDINLFQL